MGEQNEFIVGLMHTILFKFEINFISSIKEYDILETLRAQQYYFK